MLKELFGLYSFDTDTNNTRFISLSETIYSNCFEKE